MGGKVGGGQADLLLTEAQILQVVERGEQRQREGRKFWVSFWGLLAALGGASVVTSAIQQTREIAKDAALAPESWEEGGRMPMPFKTTAASANWRAGPVIRSYTMPLSRLCKCCKANQMI